MKKDNVLLAEAYQKTKIVEGLQASRSANKPQRRVECEIQYPTDEGYVPIKLRFWISGDLVRSFGNRILADDVAIYIDDTEFGDLARFTVDGK